MDAVGALGLAEQAVRIAEAAPRGVHRQHVVAHAQLPRREIDQRDVAAMAVDDDELADAGAMHALADLDEGAQRGFGRERQRAAKRPVLVRRADRLHGQEHDAASPRGSSARTRAR